MDGMTGVFVGIVSKVAGLGIDHAFSEIAATGQHKRQLEVLDRQLERTAEIARASGAPVATAVKPDIRQPAKVLPAPAAACQISEDIEHIELPTTEETITELKGRLREELYDFERDMQNGMRIANKPCDCGALKHMPHIKATSRELMSYEKNPVYGQIVSWMDGHVQEFTPKEIAKHEPAYYQAMTPEIRNFRKQIEV